ncbi:thiaminase II [Govanella unica]|uniref:Aminopyrimidine aminohydrolase n=1 Tax=Govanella unica TaxID=2975056 RepID=A0A9X3TZY6_9PROT|nr:thiaminase II [Govania unica]MDA5194557.1 thiaminase II [Govania unica]
MTKFSDDLWHGIDGLLTKILDLPFNRDLASGTLDADRFRFYVMQDSLYLNSYSRALSVASAKSPTTEAMLFFAQSAQVALEVERALHAGFLHQFGVSDADLAAAQKSPACAGYSNFLLATAATGSYEELVAAILPCFWIYWHVGQEIAKISAPDNPYQAWVDTYNAPAFADAVKEAIAITDATAAAASPAERQRMVTAFNLCSVYEWMFWDSAYRQEQWPVTV